MNLSFIENPFNILSESDWAIVDSGEEAVSFPDGTSYPFEWHCYSGEKTRVTCRKLCEVEDPNNCHEDDPESGFASVETEIDGVTHEYDYEVDETACQSRVNEMTTLLSGEDKVCFLAAYLQDIDDGLKLWSLFKIKTKHGSWGDSFGDEGGDSEDEGQ